MSNAFTISLSVIVALASIAFTFYVINTNVLVEAYPQAVDDLDSTPFNRHGDTIVTKDGELTRTHIIGKMGYTGDYKTGYTLTYSERKQTLSLAKDDGSVYSEVKPLSDRIKAVVYSEEQKSWIELALSNQDVQGKLAKKSGSNLFIDAGDNTSIQSEKFGCPEGGCSYISFYTENFASHLGVTINTNSMQVVEVQDWSSSQ